MRYRAKKYTLTVSGPYIYLDVTVPQAVYDEIETQGQTAIVTTASYKSIIDAIRLIADESRGGYVMCSTGLKPVSTILKVVTSTQLKFEFRRSILITAADGDEDDIAAIAALASGDQMTVEFDWGEAPTDAGGDPLLRDYFNITEATEYHAMTPAEAIAIARDCQYNVMGTDWPIPTWLPTGVTEAQVESAAEGLGIPYHEPTQTA